jgi:hypothetical protein
VKFEAIGAPKPDFAYYGDHPTWLVTLAQTRDSDLIERSNWRYITGQLVADYPDDVAIERMNHWAVGWVDYLLVRPGSEPETIMAGWSEVLAIYPIASDEDYEKLAAEEDEE